MNGDTFSIKAPKECSKKFAATFKGKCLTRTFPLVVLRRFWGLYRKGVAIQVTLSKPAKVLAILWHLPQFYNKSGARKSHQVLVPIFSPLLPSGSSNSTSEGAENLAFHSHTAETLAAKWSKGKILLHNENQDVSKGGV